MASAFVAFPYHQPYEEIFEQVIAPSLRKAGFNVVRADEIPTATDVVEDMKREIELADLIVIEASEANPNVYWEFGLASALNKELILIASEASALPFDTRKWRHLRYKSGDLVGLREQFCLWLGATRAHGRLRHRIEAIKLDRGESLPKIFDSTSHLTSTQQGTTEDSVFEEVKSGSMISCGHAYEMDKGSLLWLRLCQDSGYTAFHDSISELRKKGSAILGSLGDRFLALSPDYISLGPGNGQKDCVLLKHLLKHLLRLSAPTDIYYYPVDISERMLSAAIETVRHEKSLHEHLKVKAVHSDFAHLSSFKPVFDFRPSPNIFSFLGNTLGNVQDEKTLLQRVRSAMQPGDALLLEVRLKGGPIELGGNDEDHTGLSFAPLELLGVPFDANKVHVDREGCISQIEGTSSIAVYYRGASIRGTPFENVLLSCVNYYDPGKLQDALTSAPLAFELVHSVTTSSLALFVLRRPAA